MRKYYNHSIARYALILGLGIAILLAQTFKLHMHLQHDEHPASTATSHKMSAHMVLSLHDTPHDIHHDTHHDGAQDHHSAGIEVSSSGFIKKMEVLNPFVFLTFIVSLFLCASYVRFFPKTYTSKIERPPNYYLLHPPLRAPPV